MSEKMSNIEKQPEKVKKIFKAIINTIINILIVVVLIVSISIAVMSLSSKANGGLSVIFGYTVENVQTDSMKGGSEEYEGGDFAAGDVIISKYTDYIFTNEYKVGDIVTYNNWEDSVINHVCHRIIEVYDDNGILCYRTMGDNGIKSDQAEGDYASYLRASDIGSVFYSDDYHGTIIKGFGTVLSFLQTQFGFFLCILLPMIIFFLYALIRVVISATDYKKSKVEEEKQAAVDEAVAAALAAQGADKADTKPVETPTPEGMTPEQMEQFKQFLEFQKMQNAAKETAENTDNNE